MKNERFGAFIAQIRREQGFTQKELADQLNVTDKAVSIWGIGIPLILLGICIVLAVKVWRLEKKLK